MSIVYQYTQSPEAFEAEITPEDPTEIDLLTVTAVEFRVVHRRTGVVAEWPCAILEQADDRLLVRHTFASGGSETSTIGEYLISADLTVPGGVLRTSPEALSIWAR